MYDPEVPNQAQHFIWKNKLGDLSQDEIYASRPHERLMPPAGIRPIPRILLLIDNYRYSSNDFNQLKSLHETLETPTQDRDGE
jgi:hypothetical protein